jgi:transposase-like protein
MVVNMHGQRTSMWWTVDREDEVLDILAQKRRNKTAAMKFLGKSLEKQYFAPLPHHSKAN